MLESQQQVWLDEIDDRLVKLVESKQHRDVHMARLMAWGGMSVGRTLEGPWPFRRSADGRSP